MDSCSRHSYDENPEATLQLDKPEGAVELRNQDHKPSSSYKWLIDGECSTLVVVIVVVVAAAAALQ